MNKTLKKLGEVKDLITQVEKDVASYEGLPTETDTVDTFLTLHTNKCEHGSVRREQLWRMFQAWQKENTNSYVGRRMFYRAMENKGYSPVVTSLPRTNPITGRPYIAVNVWRGLELKDNSLN